MPLSVKCLIILSSKSSGSSACQNLLTRFTDINVVPKTHHYQNETLYWTKAASTLNLPQQQMLDSNVPYSAEQAYIELTSLLEDNLPSYEFPADLKQLIFDGWSRLCKQYAPVFLEKSPHHLYQWSALQLILECMDLLEDEVDFLLIGLVRNPMDTLYSAFRRWRTSPEKAQYEWLTAYTNLLKLKEFAGDKLVIVRYEDIISSLDYMKPIFDFCNIKNWEGEDEFLHPRSISEYRRNRLYGFNLANEIIQLAELYGYARSELLHKNSFLWPAYRDVSRHLYLMVKPIKMWMVDARIRNA